MGEGVHTIGKGKRSEVKDTEKGLNKQEAYTVRKLEKQIRNLEYEKGYVIGSDGKVLAESVYGDKSSARFNPKDYAKMKDAVITHNHPYAGEEGTLNNTIAGRIGVPFSDADIIMAIVRNAKEVRAVTPTYTYSIRRPKGGWNANIKDTRTLMEFQKDIKNWNRRMKRRINQYSNQQAYASGKYLTKNNLWNDREIDKRSREVSDRGNVGIQYGMVKELAKKYGFEFTRKRVK